MRRFRANSIASLSGQATTHRSPHPGARYVDNTQQGTLLLGSSNKKLASTRNQKPKRQLFNADPGEIDRQSSNAGRYIADP